MAVNYSTTVKNSRLDVVKSAIDGGGGAGKLEIGTAGMASVLVSIDLAAPSAPAASGGVLTFTMPRSGVASATGVAAEARFRDFANVGVVTGLTVGLSAADVVLDNLNINSGQNVTINSAAITHP